MQLGNVGDFFFSNVTDLNIDLISAAGDVIYIYTTFLILVYSVLAEKNGCHGSAVKLKRMLAPNLRWCLLLLLLVMCMAELAESILDNDRYWCPSLRVLSLVSIAVLTEYTERRANGMYVLWIVVYWIYSAVVRSVQLWVFREPCLESARFTFTAISLCLICLFLALDLCILIKALREKLTLSKASYEPEECQVNSHASEVSSQPGLAVTLGQSSDDVFISSSQNDMSAGLSNVPNPSSNGNGSSLITANQPAYQHANANFLSRAVFAWIVPTLIKGYKVPLELENLGKLPDVERSHTQSQRLQELLDAQKMNRQSPSLWWCYWEFTRTFLLWGGVLKLLGDVAACFGPLMIKQIVKYAEKNSNSSEYDEKYSTVNGNSSCVPTKDSVTLSIFFANGYILAVCVLLSAFLQGSLSQSSTHLLCMGGIRLRLGLQSVLYHKSLKLASWAIPAKREENAPGQTSAMDAGGLSNLMEEDTFNVMMLIWVGHYIWAIPLKIAALLVMLYWQLGLSSLIGAFVGIIVMFPLQCVLGKKMAANSNNIMVLSDERLRKVHEMLQGLRVLKIHAWEEIFKKHVQDTRSKELTLLNWDSTYWALMTFSTQASSVLITLVTFGVYTYMEGKSLSPGSAFTALALFNQLTVPLFLIPVTLPVFISARTSTRRLAEFFARPEMVCPLNTQASPSETLERIPPSLNSCLENIVEADEDESSAVTYSPVSPNVLEVSQASFTWDGDFKLNNITLSIPKGKLVMIVGSMGSGKSSLLAALLGEMKKLSGDVKWSSTGPVGFVMQKPWLLNGSIKDNILFGQVHKEKRYKKVLRACQLLEDLETLPHGEHTEVGDRGLALSGGQKSRIALARALYSRAKVLFLDDPLSALDAQVGERVFSDAIEKIALNSKRTVLLVTHNVRFMQRAHEVIVMDKGQILKQGPPSSITLDFNDVGSNDLPLRTARDRWHLLKWVSKVGVGLRLQNEDSRIYSNRRSSRSHMLTRHMSHDFPLPMDECIPELDTLEPLPNTSPVHRGQSRACVKRHSKSFPQKSSIFRTNSLQPVSFNSDGNEMNRAPVPLMRMMSSPDRSEKRRLSSTRSDSVKPSSSLTNKMRSRSGTVVSSSSLRRRGTGDSFFRRLMSFSSRRRSSLAASVAVNPEPERIPMQRHISTVSSFSEDMDEETDEETLLNSGSVDDERQYGRVPKRLFFYYLRACSWIVSCIFVLSAFSWQAVRVSTDHWLSNWSEAKKLNDSGPSDSKSGVIGDSYFQIYALLSVISVFTALSSNALGQFAGSRGRANLHRQLLDSILNAPLKIVEATPTGRILSRFSGDMGVIDKKISTSFQRLLQFVLLCGSAIVVNAYLEPSTLFLTLPIVLVYIYVQRFFCASSRELQRLDGLSKAPVISHFNETLNGLWTIRAAGRQKIVSLQMEHLLDANATAAIMANAASRWLGVALDYLGGVIVLVSTLAALWACKNGGNVTPALVGLAINYTLLTPVYLTWVVRLRAEMEMYMSAVERVRHWATLPTESSSTDANEEQNKSSDEWPVKGGLEWKEASISYGITMAPVLQDLNVIIPHGQKVGICGRTGSGKSSLIMSLVRFNEIVEGKVLIDGRDVTQIPIKELRSKIAVMPQDIVLFSGKIRWNLDPKEMFTDDQLWAALEKAQLKDYIRTLPGGLDADVVLSGQNFSAGQRQLLGLARASLLNSPILLLDEPSSQLDQETQYLMRKAMQSLFQNRTVLLIAHRMATLMECDRILVLDNGCIVEDGAPAVLKAKNGYFGSLLKVGFRV